MRKEKSITPEEFMNSDKPHAFRVNCSKYAEFHKFKKWMLREIETRKKQKSYDEQVADLCGDFSIQDNFGKKYSTRKTSPIFEVNREKLYAQFPFEDFLPKDKHQTTGSTKKSKKESKWQPSSEFDRAFSPSQRLGDEHIIRD